MFIRKLSISCALFVLAIGFSELSYSAFISSDFSLDVMAQKSSVKPGEVVIFDGILTNLSSQTANFGGNIALAGASVAAEINGQFVLNFPFIEDYDVQLFPDQSLTAGQSLRFPFVFIDTAPWIPVGTMIELGMGNLLFRNNPPSTSDPYVDFFIPIGNLASTTIPEPNVMILLGIGLLGMQCQRKILNRR